MDQSQDLSTAGQGFVAIDRASGNIIAVDRGLSVATGWAKEELVGDHWSKIVHYTDRAAAISSVSGLLESGDGRWTCRIRHEDGGFTLYQCDASVDSEGQTFYVVLRDSREMARQQQDLSQYARLSDLVEDVLVVTDAQGNVITINKAGERVHGFAREEMIGHHLSDFLPDEGLEVLVEIQRRVEAGETVIDFQIPAFGADGNLVYLEGLTTFDHETKRFYTVERNITERVNRERELEIGHRFFNLSASHLALIDNQGRILRANQALHDFASFDDDLTGEKLSTVLGVGPSGRLADSLRWVARCRSDDEFTAELVVGGEERTVAITLTHRPTATGSTTAAGISPRNSGCRPRCTTGQPPISSPGWPPVRSSPNSWKRCWTTASAQGSSCWTSTTSNESTTPSATAQETSCSARSPSGSTMWSGTQTWWLGSAVTSL